jgi:hypothetical protein
MYEIDPDPKWYDTAKDIVDFLIDHERDNKGFYPSGTGDEGRWNQERTGTAPPARVSMMSQAAAADAILRFAYLEAHKRLPVGTYKITSVIRGRALSARGSELSTSDYAGRPDQQWALTVDHDGSYSLTSLMNNVPMAVVGCSYSKGAHLQLSSASPGDCTKFRIADLGNGQSKIFHKVAKVIDAGISAQNDSPVYLWAAANVVNQRWVFERLRE